MAGKRSWDLQHRQKQRDYLFHAYVQVREPAWHVRAGLLRALATRCGDHYHWGEMIHVGPTLERQEWIIFGFREFAQKQDFEAGLPAVLAIEIKPVPGVALPNRLADPTRESRTARQLVHKNHGVHR